MAVLLGLINLQVDVVCTSRIPEFFIITLMNSAGGILRKINITYELGITDVTVSIPQSVDVCTLRVEISAGNSAGMSSPTETVHAGKIGLFLYKNCGTK